MAPNKKSLACVVQSLSQHDLSAMIKSEFLPLTSLDVKEASSIIFDTEKTSPLILDASDNYWSWSTPASLEENDDDLTASSSCDDYWNWNANPHLDLLTTAHLESNLKNWVAPNDTNRISSLCKVVKNLDSNNYWDSSSVKDREARTIACSADPTSKDQYWYAPSTVEQQRLVLLARILEEEAIRQSLCSHEREQRWKSRTADSYWHWESDGLEEDHVFRKGTVGSLPVSTGLDNYWHM